MTMEEIKGHIIARIAGGREYKKFLMGEPLTRKEAMLAQCYVCNGEEESGEDCKADSCPLYEYHPHKGKRGKVTEDNANEGAGEAPRGSGRVPDYAAMSV
jgi:hypothetical protein